MSKIVTENISKVFNAHSRNRNQVLKSVSLELPAQGLVAIFGKSGSGKTTLLNIIGGLDRQDGGKVYIDGKNVAGKADKIRNGKIGFIFQNYYLERGCTIAEILRNQMIIAGFRDEKEISRRTQEALTLVDMERFKNKQGDALSGGQKQRVAIARALVKGAEIILADEPTGNLDAENTIKVMDILKEISKTRLVVLVTHEITLIRQYADSHIKIVDGELVGDGEIGEEIVYNNDSNNIYVDETKVEEINKGGLNIRFYGDAVSTDEKIEIINEKGALYIRPVGNVTVLDGASEKRVVFKGAEKAENAPAPSRVAASMFTKSDSGRNGRLFTLGNVFRSLRKNSEEKLYSTANIFKEIFILAMAVIMCFFSFSLFEILRATDGGKSVDGKSVYTNLNAYTELKALSEELYEDIDFYETNRREGSFSYYNVASLSGISAEYVPCAVGAADTAETLGLLYGAMPEEGEVLISRSLADAIIGKLRIPELQNDRSLLLMTFEETYGISGITAGEESIVFFRKVDYVNFLGVYDSVYFSTTYFDGAPVFFDADFVTAEGVTNSDFTTEICVETGAELADNQVIVEINRNALYNMMSDTTQADLKVRAANKKIAEASTSVYIVGSKPMYVKTFEITRTAMTTDIRIRVNGNVLENIFVYIKPNLDALRTESGSQCYFEINTSGGEQLQALKARLNARGIAAVNVEAVYERISAEARGEEFGRLAIYIVAAALMFVIFYFIEKSGSLKNSKEYGIYRAIGVNRSNLLFKETVTSCINNLFGYLVFYAITVVILCARYFVMNVAFGGFVGIAVGLFCLSALVMTALSLVPYLFVLWMTPAQILSRYDI